MQTEVQESASWIILIILSLSWPISLCLFIFQPNCEWSGISVTLQGGFLAKSQVKICCLWYCNCRSFPLAKSNLLIPLRESVKNYLADFSVKGGAPPIPVRIFGQNDFPLRVGGGYPPIPFRKIPLKSIPLMPLGSAILFLTKQQRAGRMNRGFL